MRAEALEDDGSPLLVPSLDLITSARMHLLALEMDGSYETTAGH
mgnify:CR=1 FL=1